MVLSQLLIHSVVWKAREGLAAVGPRLLGPRALWSRMLHRWSRGHRRENDRCACARPVLALAEEEMRETRRAAEAAAAATTTAHAAELARAELLLRRAEQEAATAAAERDAARAAEADTRRMAETQGAAMARAVANASSLAEQATSDAENYASAVREDAARAAADHRAEMERMDAYVREAMRIAEAAAAAQGEADSVAASLRGERAAMEEAQRAAEISSARAVQASMLAERAGAVASVAESQLQHTKADLADCRARHEEARAGARRAEEAEATLLASQERARLLAADLVASRRAIVQLNATVRFFTEHTTGPPGKAPLNLTELTTACQADAPACIPAERAPCGIESLAETAASLLSSAVEFCDSSTRTVSLSLRAVQLPPDLARLRDMAVPDLADVDTSAALQPGTPLLLAPLVLVLLFVLCRPLSARARRPVSHAHREANGRLRIPEGGPQHAGAAGSCDSVRVHEDMPDVGQGATDARCPTAAHDTKPRCAVPGRALCGQASAVHAGSVHTVGTMQLELVQRALIHPARPANDRESTLQHGSCAPNPCATSLAACNGYSLDVSPQAADDLSAGLVPEYRCALVATERVRDAWEAYRAFRAWVLAAACLEAEEAAQRCGWGQAATGKVVRELERKLMRERATLARLTTPPGSLRFVGARSIGLSSAGGRSRRSHASHSSHVSEASAEIAASLHSLWSNLPVLTEPLDGRGQLASTPRRLASVTRRLLPRLAEHASPSRLLSAMLREVSLVVAEEAMRGRHLHAACHTHEGSSSSTWSGQAGGDAMSHSASWGQLTAENVQIHEERSSPVAIPELLARNAQAEELELIEDESDDGQAHDDDRWGLAEGAGRAEGSAMGEWGLADGAGKAEGCAMGEWEASDGVSEAGSGMSRA